MPESWAIVGGSDLYPDLGGTGGRRASLIRTLRDAVRTGRLAPGTRLPASRTLAADLDVARNAVADAYGELVAEGWPTARQGSGTPAEHAFPEALEALCGALSRTWPLPVGAGKRREGDSSTSLPAASPQ